MEQQEIRQKIAELRARYSKLRFICGRQGISQQTITSYANEIAKLEALLK